LKAILNGDGVLQASEERRSAGRVKRTGPDFAGPRSRFGKQKKKAAGSRLFLLIAV
jgi:hypothetical protein